MLTSNRKHVLADLTPYLCTDPDCDKADVMFDSRSEWYAHELQFHRREWTCGVPSHGVYRSRGKFAAHLRSEHANQFSDLQLPIYVSSCEKAVKLEVLQCPL